MIEAQSLRRPLAIDRKRRAGERRSAERRFVQPFARIAETPAVAREHFDIGKTMMAEGDRLRGLQMREARHDGIGMRLGLGKQRALQREQSAVDSPAGRPHPEPEIRRYLVVARARGVQPAGGVARDLAEPRFDVEMNVFERGFENEAPFGNLRCDPLETRENGVRILPGNDHLVREHVRMRAGACDILFGQPLVEIDRGVYLLHQRGGTAREAPAPHLVCAHRRSGNPPCAVIC